MEVWVGGMEGDRWMNGGVGEEVGRMEVWVGRWMDGGVGGEVGKWMDGGVGGKVDGMEVWVERLV